MQSSDKTIFDNNLIETIKWDSAIISDDNFEIGTACMAQATIQILKKDVAKDYGFENKEFLLEMGIQNPAESGLHYSGSTYAQDEEQSLNEGVMQSPIEYIPLGYFTVEKAKSNGDYDVSLTCIDRMYKMEAPYVTAVAYPATYLQIAQDIANEANVELENTSFVNSNVTVQTKSSLKTDLTCRKAIMAIAELAGGYAIINRAGKLEIINANADVTQEIKYAANDNYAQADGYLIADELIDGVTTISGDNYFELANKELPINRIDGVAIGKVSRGTCDYPLAINENNIFLQDTNAIIDNLYNALNGFSYHPFNMAWQGNPALECGDRITILGKNGARFNTIFTSRSMDFDGGMNEEYTAVGKSTTEQNSTPTPDTDIKIADAKQDSEQYTDQAKTDMKQYSDEAIEKISGNKGGYIYIKRNDDGTPSEIYIMDTSSTTTAKKCLRANKEGIAGSITGVNGPWNFSCLIDGTINAAMIITGFMLFDRLKGGTLTLGGVNNAAGLLNVVDKDGNIIDSMGIDGIKVFNGNITIQDKNGTNVITSDGVKNVFSYSSSGLYSGFQELGWQNYGGVITNRSSYLSFHVPSGIIIQNALLKVKIASKYVTGTSGVTDGYYSVNNVKAYINSGSSIPLYLDYPFAGEPAIISGNSGSEISEFGTWNVGSGHSDVQIKSIDIKNYVSAGNDYLIQIDGGASTYPTHGEFVDSAVCQVELIIEGLKQG